MSLTRIPLFPLGVVLFPGQAVPLHIFEPRYQVMTRHCMETKSPFGIVFIHDENISQIGCSVRIVKTLKQHEDGRSDILTMGECAFKLVHTYEEKAYFEADVKYLREDFSGIDDAVSAEIQELFNQCHQILYKEDGVPFPAQKGMSLAFHVASELPLEMEFRQTLLEQRSEAERQRRLAKRLAEWYPQLEKRDHVRAKATGNGHAKF